MSGTTVTINQGFTTRTARSGRQRVTVEVQSEPLVHQLDPKQLGAGPAEAIAEILRERIQSIAVTASPATLARRKRFAREAAEGLPTASQRYSGGRTPAAPPAQTDRLFNDSGRLAKSIVARAATDAANVGLYIVNVAANRLDERTFTGGAFARMLDLLRQYVPEIANPKLYGDDLRFKRAVRSGMEQMIQKQRARISELRDARAKAIVGAGRALLSLVA